MVRARSLTAEEFFLELRHRLVNDASTSPPEELLAELISMASSDPDRAARVLQALADSADKADREIAAIYVGRLLATRPSQACDLLVALIGDADPTVRTQALDTLDEATSDNRLTATQAARLAALAQN